MSRLSEDRVLFVAIAVVVLVVLWFVLRLVADALAGPPSATAVGAGASPRLRAAPTEDPGSLSGEGGVEVAPRLDGATAGRDTDRASGTAPPSPPAESDPALDRARRYNRRLERIVHRLATRAERHERTIKLQRRATRHALGTSPIGGHWIERAFLCIHEHEGSWRAATGNGYYGGLQMDLDFQRAYGREFLSHYGTANHWPMSVQLAVAIRAWLSREFSPWPTTRRFCGL